MRGAPSPSIWVTALPAADAPTATFPPVYGGSEAYEMNDDDGGGSGGTRQRRRARDDGAAGDVEGAAAAQPRRSTAAGAAAMHTHTHDMRGGAGHDEDGDGMGMHELRRENARVAGGPDRVQHPARGGGGSGGSNGAGYVASTIEATAAAAMSRDGDRRWRRRRAAAAQSQAGGTTWPKRSSCSGEAGWRWGVSRWTAGLRIAELGSPPLLLHLRVSTTCPRNLLRRQRELPRATRAAGA